jgi:hypothetical protein
MLAPQQTTSTWPISGDVDELNAIVQAQALTIHDQFMLLHEYQDVLDAAQNLPPPAPATGTGTAAAAPNGNQLTVSAAVGTIVQGAAITGTGVPAGVTILGQISGTTGGNGVYLTSAATTASGAALSFQAPAPASTWPVPNDAPTLMLIVQDQTTILRQQSAMLQAYQDLLNISATPPPA